VCKCVSVWVCKCVCFTKRREREREELERVKSITATCRDFCVCVGEEGGEGAPVRIGIGTKVDEEANRMNQNEHSKVGHTQGT